MSDKHEAVNIFPSHVEAEASESFNHSKLIVLGTSQKNDDYSSSTMNRFNL